MRSIKSFWPLAFFLVHPLHALPPSALGPETVYTKLLETAEAEWPPTWFQYDEARDGAFRITCHSHPDRPFYMGASITQTVNESLTNVEKVVDAVDKYQELFAGFDEINKTESLPEGFSVFWHRPIPVPFIPDLRYETVYLNKKWSPVKKTYRYQMKNRIDLLKSVDGMIVIDGQGAKKTRITQFLFWDGKYGPLETFSPTGIWKDNMRDVYQSNLAIKMRAENPTWDGAKLKEEVHKAINEQTIESCVETRKFFHGVTIPDKDKT